MAGTKTGNGKVGGPGVVLVTGAAGFIGRALCAQLLDEGLRVRALVRRGGRQLPSEITVRLEKLVEVDDLAGSCPREDILTGVESVVHLAGRAHNRGGDGFFRDNLDATVALARGARAAGVRRFIFLSTIKVNGEGVAAARQTRPYTAADRPRPQGPYAVSKWRAEQELERLFPPAGATALTLIRPPLVYGEGVSGNLAGLKKWLEWGLPLPVPRTANQRSLISRERLVAVITESLVSSAPARLLLCSDPEPWSTAELVRSLAGDGGRFLSLPDGLLRFGFRLLGRPEIYRKLYGSLLIARDERERIKIQAGNGAGSGRSFSKR